MNVDTKLIVIIILIFVWTTAFRIVYFVIFVRFMYMLNFASYIWGILALSRPFACKLSFLTSSGEKDITTQTWIPKRV